MKRARAADGEDGARLTHDHERQYTFVHQSLQLWREARLLGAHAAGALDGRLAQREDAADLAGGAERQRLQPRERRAREVARHEVDEIEGEVDPHVAVESR